MSRVVNIYYNNLMNKKNIRFNDYELYAQLLDRQKSLLSDLITRKGGLGWVNWIMRLTRLIYAKAPTKSNVRISKVFIKECYLITRKSSLSFLVVYLKTCFIMLQQYVARNETKYHSREIGKIGVKTNRSGLPTRLIPRLQRRLIRKGDVKTIKFYISLFGLYRYLDCSYKPVKFNTITDPGSWVPDVDFYKYVQIFRSHIERRFTPLPMGQGSPFPIEKITVMLKSS